MARAADRARVGRRDGPAGGGVEPVYAAGRAGPPLPASGGRLYPRLRRRPELGRRPELARARRRPWLDGRAERSPQAAAADAAAAVMAAHRLHAGDPRTGDGLRARGAAGVGDAAAEHQGWRGAVASAAGPG